MKFLHLDYIDELYLIITNLSRNKKSERTTRSFALRGAERRKSAINYYCTASGIEGILCAFSC